VNKLIALVALVGLTVWAGCGGQTASLTASPDGAAHEVTEDATAAADAMEDAAVDAADAADDTTADATDAVADATAAADAAAETPKTRETPTTAAPSLLIPGGVAKENSVADASQPDAEVVVLDTDRGRIVIELYPSDAPKHVANFKKLVSDRFYQGVGRTFHRYEPDFVIQGGDPEGRTSRAGSGGPGYTVPAEIKRKHLKGAVAAARQGDNVNPDRESSGSQFYICLKDVPFLDGAYTAFGQVVQGMDTVMKLRKGDEITKCALMPRSSVIQE
jgi:peptidyl-prolyl cis-trans isomerase B (cyclophilin B)